MRILQLVEHLWLGGAERMAVNISNVLQESGHQVILCPTRWKGPLENFVEPNVKLICLNKKWTFDLRAFFRLLTLVKENRIEIIHAHSTSIYWAFMVKLLKPRVKIIWHDHYGLSEKIKNSNRIIVRIASPLISAIIAVNEHLRQWSVRNTRVKPDKILLINNFPVIKELSKSTIPGMTTIVCLANLRPQKDHSTLVEAIHIIKTKYPDCQLNVIFAGLYWQDDYYIGLSNLMREYDLLETIKVVGSIENTSELLAKADIGVLSSMSEGLPVSLLEYGLAGLPVVVTNVGQCAEVVGHGKYGKVVPPKKPNELADEIIFLMNNKSLANNLGFSFKEHIKKNYGAENFMTQYGSLLNKIKQHA
jgi:glycosyltransferase involved in cell wall biosynthesis